MLTKYYQFNVCCGVFYWQPRYGETRIANENLVLGTEQIQQINLAPDIKEQLFKIY